MRYEHVENNHRIIFEDEKDYLRGRLLYLEQFSNDVSGSISFTFFIERELYRGIPGVEPIRVLNIEHIEPIRSQPFSVSSGPPYYSSRNEARMRAEQARQRQSNSLSATQETQRQMEELMILQQLQMQPLPIPIDSEQFRREYMGDWVPDEVETDMTYPPTVQMNGGPRGFTARDEAYAAENNYIIPDTDEEDHPKEDYELLKRNKKKSIFDIIDLD